MVSKRAFQLLKAETNGHLHVYHIRENRREREKERSTKREGDRRSPSSSASSASPPPDWVRSAYPFFFFPYFPVLIQPCCYNKKKILFCVLCFDYVRRMSCYTALQVKRATVATPKKIWKNLRAYTDQFSSENITSNFLILFYKFSR